MDASETSGDPECSCHAIKYQLISVYPYTASLEEAAVVTSLLLN